MKNITFYLKWLWLTKNRNMVYIGEVIGSFYITIGNRSGPLKRAASASILYQPVDVQNLLSYPLRRRVRSLLEETETMEHVPLPKMLFMC